MADSDLRDVVAVIGDVVGSRQHPDRAALHRTLQSVLDASRLPERVTPARLTVGDEFQASTGDPAAALALVWDLRVRLLPVVDVRFGIGAGQARLLDVEREIQDGSAWWAARHAIEEVKAEQQRPGRGYRRVRMRAWNDTPLVTAAAAGLVAVDALFAGLDETDLAIMRELRGGRSQREIAEALGMTQPSVSRRVTTHGIGALLGYRAGLDGEGRDDAVSGP